MPAFLDCRGAEACASRQRRIFIFGALGYFKFGAFLEGRGGLVTFSDSYPVHVQKFLNLDLGSKIFQI